MRLLQLLPLCGASAVLAKEPIAHNYGFAQSQDLLGVCEGPLCANDKSPAAILEDTGRETRELAASLWPHSTPCARNGTKEFCVYSNPEFAGRGITIFTSPSRAVEIAQSPVFKDQSIVKNIDSLNADESPRWRVDEVPGKGMGLTATRNMEMGDLIMSTSASVMVDYDLFYEVTEAQLLPMQAAGVDYLPEKHQKTFLNLSTHDGADNYEQRVSKIIATNAFDITDQGLVSKNEHGEENYYTIFPEISRMNHDCRPNADYHFDPDTYTQHIHAARPIAAGEEITISYIDPVQTRKQRLERLDHSWHFPCSCSLCTQNKHQEAASDARIKQIGQVREQLRSWEATSQASTAMAELLISLYEMERLSTMMYEAYTYAALEYNGAGEPWTATKYARLAIHHGLSTVGPKDSDVVEMNALVRDPWQHWSWLLRTRRRMNWYSHPTEDEEESSD